MSKDGTTAMTHNRLKEDAYKVLLDELLTCASSDELTIIDNHPELIDEEFIAALCRCIEQKSAKLKADKFVSLEKCAQKLYLYQLLQTISESNGDLGEVHRLLKLNQSIQNQKLAGVLDELYQAIIFDKSAEEQQNIGYLLLELGNILMEYPLGDHENKTTLAISAFQCASVIFKSLNLPLEWASAQGNLGAASLDLAKIAANLQSVLLMASINAFKNALGVYTDEEYPEEYAQVCSHLGNAHICLAEFGVNPHDECWNSITSLKNGIRACKRQKLLQKADLLAFELGSAYIYLAMYSVNPRPKIEEAIKILLCALQNISESEFPLESGIANEQLGFAYLKLAPFSDNPIKYINNALDALRLSLRIIPKDVYPFQWAQSNSNLGGAYRDLAEFSKDPRLQLENALTCFAHSLKIFTEKAAPQEFAYTNKIIGDTYLELGSVSYQPHDYINKAIYAYSKSLEIYKVYERPYENADLLNSLGYAYVDLADYSTSPREEITKAIGILAKNLNLETGDPFQGLRGHTYNILGIAYAKLAEFDSNPQKHIMAELNSYQHALKILTRDRSPRDFAHINNNIGLAYGKLAELSDSPSQMHLNGLNAFNNALLVCKENKWLNDFADTSNNIGNAYLKYAHYSDNQWDAIQSAIINYLKGLQCLPKDDQSKRYAMLNLNLGNALHACSNLSMGLFSSYINPSKELLQAINNQLDQAERYSNIALRFFNSTDWPTQYAMTNITLGCIYSSQAILSDDSCNYYVKAINAFNKSLGICTEDKFPHYWSLINNNLGTAYGKMASFSANTLDYLKLAIKAYTNALRIRSRSESPAIWAQTNSSLGDIYASFAHTSNNPSNYIRKAIVFYANALQVFDPQTMALECFNTASSLGDLCLKDNRYDVAIENFTLAIRAIENLRLRANSPDHKSEIMSWAFHVYGKLIKVYVYLQDYGKAIAIAERSRCRNIVDDLFVQTSYPKGDDSGDFITRWDELRRSIAHAQQELNLRYRQTAYDVVPDGRLINQEETLKRSLFQQRAVKAVKERLIRYDNDLRSLIEGQIQVIDESYLLHQTEDSLCFTDLQSFLVDERSSILYWFDNGNELLVFILTSGNPSPMYHCYPKEARKSLTELFDTYFQQYYNNKLSWERELPSLLSSLSSLLEIPYLENKIKNACPFVEQLIIIPHLFLHLLPLHMLPLPSFGECLIDRFVRGVRFAPSLQALQIVQKRKMKSLNSFFAITNPTEDLPYSDMEVATIQKLFATNSTVLQGKNATRSQFDHLIKSLPTIDCLHFSCHGTFNYSEPLQSALLLAGSLINAPPAKDNPAEFLPTVDGRSIDIKECLTILDIFLLDLRQTRIVTLSACESSLSDLKWRTDDFVGLSTAFLMAGANSVIGTLWTVPDISTGLLMAQFYRLIKAQIQEGLPGDVAMSLKQAQGWLRTCTLADIEIQLTSIPDSMRDDFAHDIQRLKRKHSVSDCPFSSPYYWAAFTAVGQ